MVTGPSLWPSYLIRVVAGDTPWLPAEVPCGLRSRHHEHGCNEAGAADASASDAGAAVATVEERKDLLPARVPADTAAAEGPVTASKAHLAPRRDWLKSEDSAAHHRPASTHDADAAGSSPGRFHRAPLAGPLPGGHSSSSSSPTFALSAAKCQTAHSRKRKA